MQCVYCGSEKFIKFGYFYPPMQRHRRVQRFRCKACLRTFSEQTLSYSFRSRTTPIDTALYGILCSGLSQRRTARCFGLDQKTIARKIIAFGLMSEKMLELYRLRGRKVRKIVFDEMQSFEHTKCKPPAMAVAVEDKTRRILSITVSEMPANGHLATISRKRYGPRQDGRTEGLMEVMRQLRACVTDDVEFKSDLCPRYPGIVKAFYPNAKHRQYKGRRGCVVGQGELKRGGYDPLFSLNHSCAMYRDNLKRLTRKTWCTTKRRDRLNAMMHMYACYHNYYLERKRKRLRELPMSPIYIQQQLKGAVYNN